jgi:excinuclease ABC subunit A
MQSGTPTGQFLAGHEKAPERSRRLPRDFLVLADLTRHNLKKLTVRLPRQAMIGLCGVSGSGKSTLLSCLLEQVRDAVWVDQSPVGATPRANPATYVGAFDDIRKEFAQHTGRPASLFTFNGGGACPACNGLGLQIVDMHFLGDVRQPCPECGGRRYSPEALEARYRERTIADLLDLTIEQARDFFTTPKIRRKLGLLVDVGLGYLRLGQPLSTLSGGEAQRVKLASELNQRGRFYALDEPTRGLHHADVARLSLVLHQLVEAGNSVVVVEHNVDVLAATDWLIELGPGGGRDGGQIVCAGPPEQVAACEDSPTGKYLATVLGNHRATGKARSEAS